MEGYDLIAEYYGYLTRNTDYAAWYRYLRELSFPVSVRGRRIADLGCGSGEMLSRFYADGADVTGVDMSGEMLSLADERLYRTRSLGGQFLLVHGDMCSFVPRGGKMDMAYSSCDSMNYPEREEITGLIGTMKTWMNMGGIFTFDMINPSGDIALHETIRRGEGDIRIERSVSGKVMTTVLSADGKEYIFKQNLYTEDDIRNMCDETGTRLEGIYDFFTTERTDPFCDKLQYVIRF